MKATFKTVAVPNGMFKYFTFLLSTAQIIIPTNFATTNFRNSVGFIMG